MKLFKISDKIEIICEAKKTRNGFKHKATLLLNKKTYETVNINYLNRTWERYEFQSVLSKLIDKTTALSEDEIKLCHSFIAKDHTDWSGFRAVSMVAQLGELFCDNQKEKNDWKARMLKAGLGNMGLQIPEE
jgi:hypothetical protein